MVFQLYDFAYTSPINECERVHVLQGIGLGIVSHYLQQDSTTCVVATTRNVTNAVTLNELAKKYADRVHVFALDVDNDQSIKAFASSVEKTFDHVDVLVNNAGVLPDDKPLKDV